MGSGIMMVKLNSDLLLEIFTRLRKEDVKSVLQCRKVCKLWRRLLGKPKIGMLFARTPRYRYDDSDIEIYYKEQPSESVNSNFTEEEQKFVKIVTKTYEDDPMTGFKIIGCCNGLVCYRNHKDGVGDVLYIFNPITGERIQVPGTCKYYMCAGFGYCHSTDTYKVVKCSRIHNCKKQFQVYTLGDGRGWRVIPKFNYTLLESGVYVNGALLWLNGYSKHSGCRLNGDVLWANGYSKTDIVAFDLADETFRSLPSPPCRIPFGCCTHVNLGLLGQHLYVVLRYKKKDECMIDIWVFQKKNMNNCRLSTRIKERTYFNSFTWIKKFSGKWDSNKIPKCHQMSLTESEILQMQNGVLLCYKPKTTALQNSWCHIGPDGDVLAIPHMNSVVSLKDFGEQVVDKIAVCHRMLACDA